MRVPPRLTVRALGLAGLVLCCASVARAQDEGIDDPKVQRRLGSRIDLPGAPGADASPVVPLDAQANAGFSGGAPASLEVRPSDHAGPGPETRIPHVKIGYRWLNLAQVGPGLVDGAGASEAFHVVSLDFYPVSSYWRFGLSTQYGWETGTFRANGDAFIAQSFSLGGQIPGPVFTPFFEGHAGGGLMQRTHEGLSLTSIASAYLQLGLDAGTEIFMARYAYFSVAIGIVRASNWWVRKDEFGSLGAQSLSVNTFTFKLGFGL